MRLRELLTDDDAVSPVIGVILMVAITVILAAVIASFVLGLGDSQDVAPNTNFQYDYDRSADNLTISVSGGDRVQAGQLGFAGNNIGDFDDADFWGDDTVFGSESQYQESSQLSAGDRVTGQNVEDDYEIDIIWTSEDGDTSSTLSSNSGPNA